MLMDVSPTRQFGITFYSYLASVVNFQPTYCLSIGERSFASAGPQLWNSLPDDITSASSLTVFRRKLKTRLFRQSYPNMIMYSLFVVVLAIVVLAVIYLGHLKNCYVL